MAVALTALVVAAGGSAFAAAGEFASSDDGLVQACVAKADIINSITDPVLGGVNSATSGALNSVTTAVTPKGTLIVVAPDAKCPANTEQQSLSSTPATQHAQATSKARPVGASKTQLTSLMVPAGSTPVTATLDIVAAEHGVDSTIKCVFVDAAGKTIANTTSALTIPAHSGGQRFTLPLSALVTLVEPAEVGLACKDSAGAGTSNRASRSRASGGSLGARAAIPSFSDVSSQMGY